MAKRWTNEMLAEKLARELEHAAELCRKAATFDESAQEELYVRWFNREDAVLEFGAGLAETSVGTFF